MSPNTIRNEKALNMSPIIYGYSKDDERFSANLSVDPKLWIVQITINGLAANTTYFFKVQPINGCVPGPVSNTLGITTAGNPRQQAKYFKSSGLVQRSLSNIASSVSKTISKPIEVTPPTSLPGLPNPTQSPTIPAPEISTPAPKPLPAAPLSFWGKIVQTVKGIFGF